MPITSQTPNCAGVHTMSTSFHNKRGVHNQVNHQDVHGDVNHYVTYNLEDKRQQLDRSDADLHKDFDDAILASLAFPQMTDRRRTVNIPHRQTCQWIFGLNEYQDWKTQSSGMLWIKGKPGAGKSTLMSHLYSAIRAERSANKDDAMYLEFFFSAYGAPLQRSSLGMLRSLSNQIFHYDPTVRPLLRASYKEKQTSFGSSENSWEWQQPELEKLFVEMVLASACRQKVVIFVDALDEAGEMMARDIAYYFHSLNDHIHEQSGQLRICISCRPYPVPPKFQAAVEVHVDKHNRNDIESCIRDRLRSMMDSGEEWQALLHSLATMANGVFQWVRLVLPLVEKRISDGDSPNQVQQWLPQSLSGLEDVYEYIFEQVLAQEYRKKSLRLFQWVCLATRPLSVTELRYALAAHDIVADPLPELTWHKSSSFVDTDKTMELRIGAWSGGLIEVVYDESGEISTVQPIHLSVNSFIQSRGFKLLRQGDSPYDDRAEMTGVIATYHAELYWACLKYLAVERTRLSSLIDMLHGVGPYDRRRQIEPEFPLAEYTALSALVHAESAQGYRGRDLKLEVQLLEYVIPVWVILSKAFWGFEHHELDDGTTPMHIAAAANLLDLVLHLLAHGVDVLTTDVDQKTALHVASEHGHLAMVKTLVEAGACLQAVTKSLDTPSTLAASQGHVGVFSWLLRRDASLGAAAEGSEAALYVAALHGRTIIVKLCIEADVEVNAQGGAYGNALQAASVYGHKEVVQTLLQAGAEVNAQGGHFGNALQAASLNGHKEVVQTLLQAGAEVNAQEEPYGNALQAASLNGHKEVVQTLLQVGADVNAQGGHFGNALQAASLNGHMEVVQALLQVGADVNAQGGHFGNALQAASLNGHKEVVQTLLQAGAEVNAQGGFYGNTLQAASCQGYKEVVQILLQAGADVNAQGGEYSNALQAASRYGHEEVMQILLQVGADVNAQGGKYGNALQAASCQGDREVVQILLQAGADVNAQGGEYGNALRAASIFSYEEVVQMLIQAGADVRRGRGQ